MIDRPDLKPMDDYQNSSAPILNRQTWQATIVRLLIGSLASATTLWLLWQLVATTSETEDGPQISTYLEQVVWSLLVIYFVAQILQILLRALRYRILLRPNRTLSEPRIIPAFNLPGLKHIFLVALCRNMMVDLFPARLGELSYVLMLNRGYRVPASLCFSSLVASFVFDLMALGLLLLLILLASIGLASLFPESLTLVFFAALALIVLATAVVVTAIQFFHPLARWLDRRPAVYLQRLAGFLRQFDQAIHDIRRQGIYTYMLSLSLLIRVVKYGGLYLLFIAVTKNSFPDLNTVPWTQILMAFIGAEAAASLPVPSLMSFGVYEAGGLLTLSLQGFDPSKVLLAIFLVHLLSQIVDYVLGGLGLFVFSMVAGKRASRQDFES